MPPIGIPGRCRRMSRDRRVGARPRSSCNGCGHRRRRQSAYRCRYGPFLLPSRSGRTARCRRSRCGTEGALCERPVPGCADRPGRRPDTGEGGRESYHSSACLRGQQEDQGRAAQERSAVETGWPVVSSSCPRRRQSHHRPLSTRRPFHHPRRTKDHRPQGRSCRSHLRDQGTARRPGSGRSGSLATRPTRPPRSRL